MRSFVSRRYALIAIVNLALLAGCGAAQPLTVSTSPVVQQQLDDAPTSRLFVDANCVSKPFSGMCMFAFPSGHYLSWIEQHDFAHILGMCQGPRGYIFITGTATSSGSTIAEYNYGGSSINFISDGYDVPQGCSFDAKSRHLAVANIAAYGYGGNLSVFDAGTSSYPNVYTSPDIYTFTYCSYDDKGNLFVDGTDQAGAFKIAELANRAHTLKTISLSKDIKLAGPIQWDGRALAVGYGNANGSLIFRMSVSGSEAHLIGATRLDARIVRRTQFRPFWIQGNRIVASFSNQGSFPIGIWAYPAGGDPVHLLREGTNSDGQRIMTVALAPG